MEVKDLYKNGETWKATIKEVLWFGNEGSNDAVVVYKVGNSYDELPFHDFYIVVHRFGDKEYVSGAGSTIIDALEDAERNFQRMADEIYCYEGQCHPDRQKLRNLYREAIEKLKEMEKLEKEGNNMLFNY